MFAIRKYTRRRAALVAAACALLTGGGVATAAVASIPGPGGVIHGCYGKSGRLRVTDTSTGQSCRKLETSLTWNQAGPAGPPGARGPQGPQGPSGTSLTFTVAQGGTSVAGIGSFETAILTCPPSYPLMISGGYDIENSQTSPTDYAVVFSEPVNANSWEVRIAVPADAPANVSWHVQGVCAAQS
jgi:hypothetical protein